MTKLLFDVTDQEDLRGVLHEKGADAANLLAASCVCHVLSEKVQSTGTAESRERLRRRRQARWCGRRQTCNTRCSRYMRNTCSRVRVFAKRARKAVTSAG